MRYALGVEWQLSWLLAWSQLLDLTISRQSKSLAVATACNKLSAQTGINGRIAGATPGAAQGWESAAGQPCPC